MNQTYYIGLDVHKNTIAIAIAIALGGSREDAAYHGQCAGSVQCAERTLRKLAKSLGVERAHGVLLVPKIDPTVTASRFGPGLLRPVALDLALLPVLDRELDSDLGRMLAFIGSERITRLRAARCLLI